MLGGGGATRLISPKLRARSTRVNLGSECTKIGQHLACGCGGAQPCEAVQPVWKPSKCPTASRLARILRLTYGQQIFGTVRFDATLLESRRAPCRSRMGNTRTHGWWQQERLLRAVDLQPARRNHSVLHRSNDGWDPTALCCNIWIELQRLIYVHEP